MTIPFHNIPGNLRVPLFYAELDNSRANTNQAPQRALLIGQKTAAGTMTANIPVVCQSTVDSRAAAGPGSILAGMIDAYRAVDKNGEMWVLPVADDGAAVSATGSVSFTGPNTRPGTLSLYIGGRLVSVPVAVGTTANAMATAVTAAIQAANISVTAAVDGTTLSKVNLTARNGGECGNDIDLQYNYKGAAGGEQVPFGASVTFVAMSGGTTNPSLTTALANLNDAPFDFIACSLTDATSLAAIAALLSDDTGRWSWSSQVYGHCWICKRGTAGANATFATGLNNQHLTNIPVNGSPTPPWKWAAAFMAGAAVSLRQDMAQPLQFLPVPGLLPPPQQSLYPITVRNNTLLYGGCATWFVDTGTVVMENITTTYVTNVQGNADDSYLEVETLFNSIYVLRQLRGLVQATYGRKKLAANGTRLLPGSNVVTPDTIRADLIAKYRELEGAGFVQQSEEFTANLVVEQNASNPNRVDVLFPAVLIDQLRVFAVLFQFRLV
jgi:phage tail sheath gpL-like